MRDARLLVYSVFIVHLRLSTSTFTSINLILFHHLLSRVTSTIPPIAVPCAAAAQSRRRHVMQFNLSHGVTRNELTTRRSRMFRRTSHPLSHNATLRFISAPSWSVTAPLLKKQLTLSKRAALPTHHSSGSSLERCTPSGTRRSMAVQQITGTTY